MISLAGGDTGQQRQPRMSRQAWPTTLGAVAGADGESGRRRGQRPAASALVRTVPAPTIGIRHGACAIASMQANACGVRKRHFQHRLRRRPTRPRPSARHASTSLQHDDRNHRRVRGHHQVQRGSTGAGSSSGSCAWSFGSAFRSAFGTALQVGSRIRRTRSALCTMRRRPANRSRPRPCSMRVGMEIDGTGILQLARGPGGVVHQYLQRAGQFASKADDIAIAHLGQRAAGDRFGRYVDGSRHLAGCAAHPAVGDQAPPCNPLPCSTASGGVSLCSSGMPLACGPCQRTTQTTIVAFQLTGLECLPARLLALSKTRARRFA